MEIPIIKTKVDVTQLESAINLANELIEKIEHIKKLTEQFEKMVSNINFNIEHHDKQEDC